MNVKAIIFLLSISMFFSCEDPAEVDTLKISITQKNTSDQERFNQLMDSTKQGDSDSYELKDVRREGSKLLIDVAFSGGCAEHEFELVWPEVITMIYPPVFSAILIHQNGGDSCEAYISKTLEFDLNNNGVVGSNDFAVMHLTIINGSNTNQSVKMK